MKKKKAAYARIDNSDEIKRLNRILGQVDGIRTMLKDQRKLDAVLMQCKAVHSALRSVETRLVKAHLEMTLDEVAKIEKKKGRAEKLAELEALFKQAA